MTSSRQSLTWVSSLGGEATVGIELHAPGEGGQRDQEAKETRRGRTTVELSILTSVTRGVEPPLRADPEEMLDAANRIDIVDWIERLCAGVPEAGAIDEPELRAAVVAATGRRQERDDADARHPSHERTDRIFDGLTVGADAAEDAALLRLVRALDREAANLAEEHGGAGDDDALVDVLEIEARARVAERSDVAAEHHPDRPIFIVGADRGQELVRAGRRLVRGELVRRGQISIGCQAGRIADEQVDVGVAVAGEGADLTSDDHPVIAGQRLEHARLRPCCCPAGTWWYSP